MQKIEINDFLNQASISKITYSPSGNYCAFIITKPDLTTNNYLKDIWLLKDDNLNKLTNEGNINDFCFINDNTLLIAKAYSSNIIGEHTTYFNFDINTKKYNLAFDIHLKVSNIQLFKNKFIIKSNTDANYPDYYQMNNQQRQNVEDIKKENKDYEIFDEIPFWANKSGNSWSGFVNKKRERLFIYDPSNNSLNPISDPLFDVLCFAINNNSILYAGEKYNSKQKKKHQFYLYDLTNNKLSLIHPEQDYFVKNIKVLNDEFIFIGSDQKRYGVEENHTFYKIDEKGIITCISHEDQYLGDSINVDLKYGKNKAFKVYNNKLYYLTTRRMSCDLYAIDINGNIEPILEVNGAINDFDIANNKIIYTAFINMKPQELYYFDLTNKTNKQLTNLNIFKDKYIAQPEHITFNNHNYTMDGWILKPYNYDQNKKYPAILSIHGGPRTMYAPVFHHEMQLLASHGYFVIYCNPEGSCGLGNGFADLRGKYGTIDYEDIMLFVDTVLNNYPNIDKDKLGVIGGSYGGFMVNWIITHSHRFKVAIAQRSISNWITQCGCSDQGPWFAMDQMGVKSFADGEKLWNTSPLKYSDNVITPTLFMHANNDHRCDLVEDIQMFQALKINDVPSKFIYFKDENHHLSRTGKPTHRIKRLIEMINWLDNYLMEDK